MGAKSENCRIFRVECSATETDGLFALRFFEELMNGQLNDANMELPKSNGDPATSSSTPRLAGGSAQGSPGRIEPRQSSR